MIYQLTSLCFLAFSASLVFESRQMEYYTELGPGPGFFPFWLGLALGILSFIWLIQITKGPRSRLEAGFIPNRLGLVRIFSILVAMILFAWIVEILGFQLTMLVFLGFLLIALGRQKLFMTAAVALLGSFGVYYIFTRWLDVRLPASSIEFLRNLGL